MDALFNSKEDLRIFIVDYSDTGHHKIYFQTLKNQLEVKGIIDKVNFPPICKRELKEYILTRYLFFKKWIEISKKKSVKIIHFLCLDPFYVLGPLLSRRNINNINAEIKILGTLHHVPRNLVKMKLLKSFSKNLDCIIVHSEYLQYQLFKHGIKNVEMIDYPAFHTFNTSSKEYLKSKYGINHDSVVLTFLGGTRKNKGLDILLKSFKFMNWKIKKKVLLNIAGPEVHVKFDMISKMCSRFNINARIELRYLSEQEFAENVEMSDIVVLPYRKTFSGNSGPMTEAVYRRIPVIGPDYGNLGYLIKKYRLGYTFKVENSKSLAKVIEFVIQNNWKPNFYSEQYRKRLEISNFIEKHRRIYRLLLNEDIKCGKC
ncbi:MAG: glycosyltransferase [Thermosipho sp. (in: Bacteria)]|nr:glycosyltransferase [Thermosipho sp. (in: thermotogales)]